MGAERVTHWDTVYRTKQADEVSWFQAEAAQSMRLITERTPRPGSVIDVGAGASLLVDSLLGAGITDVTVLDISEEALAAVRTRTTTSPTPPSFVVADVTTWTPDRRWDAWHDRAVFHFLTDPDDRTAYVTTAHRAIAPGGVAIVATFAPDGPEQCSGLPTVRYDADALAAEFGAGFALERTERELHRTPSGGEQPFTWVVLRRR